MYITSANTGDVLCLYQTGHRIRILGIEDGLISFQDEAGDHYFSREKHMAAFVDRDPVRIARFDYNCKIGTALNAAESKALDVLSDVSKAKDVAERADAERVLTVVQQQKDVLLRRIEQDIRHQTPDKSLVKAFLDQLYESGTGSHDTFFGLRVENSSGHLGNFLINGRHHDYGTALQYLCHRAEPQRERKAGLDAQIAGASSRRSTSGKGSDLTRTNKDLSRN